MMQDSTPPPVIMHLAGAVGCQLPVGQSPRYRVFGWTYQFLTHACKQGFAACSAAGLTNYDSIFDKFKFALYLRRQDHLCGSTRPATVLSCLSISLRMYKCRLVGPTQHFHVFSIDSFCFKKQSFVALRFDRFFR